MVLSNGTSRRTRPPVGAHTGAGPCATVAIHRLVPARRHRRRVGRGGQVGLGARPARARGDDGGRRGTGRPPPAGPGHRRGRPADRRRGRGGIGRGRPGGGREPVLAPPQPGRRVGRRGRPAGAGRPCSTTTTCPGSGPPGRPSAPAGRPGVAARHHQRAEPARAGRARHRRGHRLQHVRHRPAAGSARAGAGRPRALARRTAWCSSRPAASPARTWPAASPWPRPPGRRTGSSGRPRTATAPSSTGCSPAPAARSATARHRGRQAP